ncbi:MAG TPA: ABC transporter ATP-binding protein, partial [Umezawaea sp.]|nr:ABC transporter ATP-binding protein [Umezawaea sp.]
MRHAVRRGTVATALAVRAAPGPVALYVVLTLATGTLPVATAWLTKLVLDGLASAADPTGLVGSAAGLAGIGVAVGVVPHVLHYLRAELDREVGVLAKDRLFTAVAGFAGLSRFEDPGFLDRLRLAQDSGGLTPTQVVDGGLGVARSAIAIVGFLGSLLVLSSTMAVVVLLAALPVLVAEVALSRRRARLYWELGPAERREFFHAGLLSTVEAAKEVRLFDLGAFLRRRMMADRRVVNAAQRLLDRREVLAQTGLGLLAAVVAGAGLLWAVTRARSGQLTTGDIAVFVAAVGGVQGALGLLAGDLARTHQSLLL